MHKIKDKNMLRHFILMKSIIDQLRGFKKNVNKDYPVKRMILFGSRAKGRAKKDSDVDLMIVSDKFKRLNFMKRASKMYDYWNMDYSQNGIF